MAEFLAYIAMGVITGFIIYLMCYHSVKKQVSYTRDHEVLKRKVIEDPGFIVLMFFGALIWPFSLFVALPGMLFIKGVCIGYEYLIDKIYGEKKNDK